MKIHETRHQNFFDHARMAAHVMLTPSDDADESLTANRNRRSRGPEYDIDETIETDNRVPSGYSERSSKSHRVG